jgi:aminotransferase
LSCSVGCPQPTRALKLLNEEKVAAVPGTAFGECGEGFIRCAYATSMDNLKEAMVRLKRFVGKL